MPPEAVGNILSIRKHTLGGGVADAGSTEDNQTIKSAVVLGYECWLGAE